LYVIENVLAMTKGVVSVSDSFEGLQDLLSSERRVIAVVDRRVGEIYHQSIPVQERIFIDASEENKTLPAIAHIVSRLLEMEADRNILLLGIGGGITTDITGYAASVYKRGVRFAFLPTTLLAQVDASIGGKNGVNHNGFKNVIGTFSQPSFTWSNTVFLDTLPERELHNGVSELLKTLIIGDRVLYSRLVVSLKRGDITSGSGWTEYIKAAAKIKLQIVESDFFDTGERMKLNLGHTFGHAIEKCASVSGMDISHGEAVAAGVIIAARLSEKMGYARPGTAETICRDYRDAGLVTETTFSAAMLSDSIRNDKKRDGDSINFVFIRDIGDVVVDKIALEDLAL